MFLGKTDALTNKDSKEKQTSVGQEHKLWSPNQLKSIIWSDEARFEVCVGDSRSRVIRTKEVFQNDCLKKN